MLATGDNEGKRMTDRESMPYDLVIVGGGPSGLAAAIRAKQLAAENGLDGLHVNTVHGNYVSTVKNRMERKVAGQKVEVRNAGGISRSAGGFYDLGRGHAMIWSEWPNPEASPLWPQRGPLAMMLSSRFTADSLKFAG